MLAICYLHHPAPGAPIAHSPVYLHVRVGAWGLFWFRVLSSLTIVVWERKNKKQGAHYSLQFPFFWVVVFLVPCVLVLVGSQTHNLRVCYCYAMMHAANLQLELEHEHTNKNKPKKQHASRPLTELEAQSPLLQWPLGCGSSSEGRPLHVACELEPRTVMAVLHATSNHRRRELGGG